MTSANGLTVVKYEKKNGTAYVTLNRPKQLNAYNIQMRDELYQVLQAIEDDPDIRVTILQGAGEKAFCAGADLTEFLTAPSPIIAREVRRQRDIWAFFLNMSQPLIAALHGYVLGSGIEIALCCDIRIASEDARFGLPEAGLGLIPAAGGTQTLGRTVGQAKAIEMMLTGRLIDAGEAHRFKLVNKVVPRDKLTQSCEHIARQIKSFKAPTVKAAKKAIINGIDMELGQGLEMEAQLSIQAILSL